MARVSPTIAAGFGWLALVAALVSGLGSAANSVIAKKMPLNATQATVLLWLALVLANIPMAFVLREDMPSVGWHIEWVYLVILMLFSGNSYFIKLFCVIISFFKLAYIQFTHTKHSSANPISFSSVWITHHDV